MEVGQRLAEIFGGVIEEHEHRSAHKLVAVFHQRLGVDGPHQHLQAAHRDPRIRTERWKLVSHESRQLTE